MSAFVQPTAAFPPAQPDDPNSPVLFKDNISLVQTQITTVRSLTHEALNAIPEATEPPTEEQLADQAKKAIETLFTLHTRMQETASVAASIMSAPEQAPRR
ncbi:hypothetical protein EI94DRAFT_1794766 [Lactarius quietus]|nr:hypothetical protein EI94DRAFT_1794766 [Lactarius quietus]